ncbi:thiopurine S-methyltransferase [Thalassotalea sp. HSM 43]|uniref:thiopurine S-methyltransferase n=1 Tax=Thalassotalea sp. HSM 43 TaxID=2552945 RepID=UPI001080681A|nr:thiopurine S-methyltransferase [Thalassotalea sp. HSM 43]QBY03214.1 thiopurine S-methyltransferase [Thalassotalea sp. HSM 43]
MKQEFWHNCWDKTQIGFHQDELQPLLVEYFPSLLSAGDSRIFVPLCGKSTDLLFFADRFKVIGSELSAIACKDFFRENQLDAQITPALGFNVYKANNVEIYQGDFFALDANLFQPFDWVYDRAALIALPEAMRADYAYHLRSFIKDKTRVFLLTLEFDQSEMDGPPFSVSESDVRQLFDGFKVSKKAERDLVGQKFARRNLPLSHLKECLYIISKG